MSKSKREKIPKRLIFGAIGSVFLALAVSVGVFVYFFADFDRPQTIVVPSLVGIDESDISDFEDFSIRRQYVNSDVARRGIIISQSPHGSTKKKKTGAKHVIDVTVSLGKEEIYMPKLESLDESDACTILRQMGLKMRIVPIYSNGGQQDDKVLSTYPKADSLLDKGQTVTLFVSRERTESAVVVNDYTSLSRERACFEIESQGLCVGNIALEYSSEIPKGYVISQSLPEGTRVTRGSRVDLRVSAGEEFYENVD